MAIEGVLVLGLDGLEPALVERWIAAGRMPNLARLREAGRWGVLESTLPYATFPAWTSFMTGVGPGQHGVFDFARRRPGTYEVEFIGAGARRRPSVARLVSDAGLRVASVGFPGTYPPEAVNGVMIGGFDSPVAVGIDASFAHPPELAGEIEARFGRYVFADFAETRSWLPGWHRRAARRLMTGLRRRRAVACWLAERERWDVFMVHFGESDTAAHHFWAFMDEGSPRRPEGFDEGLAGVLEEVYAALDVSVGALLARMGPRARVLVASDHGFGGSGDKVFHLNRWLAEQGWLGFLPGASFGQRVFGAALGAGLALAPGRVQERLWRMAGPWASRAESRRRFAGIDWRRTAAFSDELSYNPVVRLNIAGRDPEGVVRAEDEAALVASICERLMGVRDPWSGAPLVASARPREAIYQGDALGESAEIVIDLALDGVYSYNLLSSSGPGPVWRRLEARERLGAKGAGMNGTHRREGFWLLAGPGVAPRRKRARMVDMAPTLLAALGLAAPPWMEGASHLAADNLRPAPASCGGGAPNNYTKEQEKIVEDRLRRLGYLG